MKHAVADMLQNKATYTTCHTSLASCVPVLLSMASLACTPAISLDILGNFATETSSTLKVQAFRCISDTPGNSLLLDTYMHAYTRSVCICKSECLIALQHA